MVNQRGLIPIVVIISLLTVFIVGAAVIYLNKITPNITPSTGSNQQFTFSPDPSITPVESDSGSNPQPPSAFQTISGRIKNPQPSVSPSPLAVKKTPSPLSTLTATPTSTSTLAPTPTPQSRKNSCDINVIYGKLDRTASDPLLATLVSSFSGIGNVYITGAQWDFNGDGNWDTDMKQSNGTIEHTYGSAGTYTVKLQVQGSDGSTTAICSKSVTVPSGITVRVTGRIYADVNCNNFPEPDEKGVASAAVRILRLPENFIYAELTTDSSGNFNFSQNIQPNDSLSVSVGSGVVPVGFKSNPKFNNPSYGLGGSQTSINLDIPIVPIDNLGACF